jgi:hypothetical protein
MLHVNYLALPRLFYPVKLLVEAIEKSQVIQKIEKMVEDIFNINNADDVRNYFN